ncbi:MAG: ROK family protein [Spirochaetaceae bacterium]|nr:ROK family protein [Spirochaetaceae bacterium]
MKSINPLSDINVSRILRLVWKKKGISRVEIANTLNLDKSTVTKIVSSLTDVGIVKEIAEGSTGPQGGRKPIYLEISKSFACVGGIEINPERFVCCLINLQGEILFQYQENFSPEIFAALQIEGVFQKAYNLILKESQKLGIKMICVGLGFPALVNSDKGLIESSVPLMINENYPIVESLKKYTNLPILIENDARCCCSGELMNQTEDFVNNSVFVLAEYRLEQPKSKSQKNLSIGLGLVMDGKILKGPEFSAGEFRSILWEPGTTGQFLSKEDNLTYQNNDSNPMESVFSELAMHIAFLINILNLQCVFIGGIEEKYIENLKKVIKDRILVQWPYSEKKNFLIRSASFKSLAVAYGAAALCVDNLFYLPKLDDFTKINYSILDYIFNTESQDKL